VISGTSAGGTLTLVLLKHLQQFNLPKPGGAVLISPLIDFNQSTASYIYNRDRDVLLTPSVREFFQSQILSTTPFDILKEYVGYFRYSNLL
jgi:acetyl esterase/lipase